MIAAIMLMSLLGTEPAQEMDERVLDTAVDEVRRAEAFYRKVLAVHGRQLPFSWVVRQERRHVRRLARLVQRLGHPVPEQLWREDEIEVPKRLAEACAQAVQHELRQAAVYEMGREVLGSGRGQGLFRRLARRTRYKHLPRFESCVRRN